MDINVVRKQVQIVHPEKVFPYLPGLNDSTLAPLYGLSADEYRSIKNSFAENVSTVAQALLSAEPVRRQVAGLPFQKDDVVLVLGESNTDDFQSWFELFATMVTRTIPDRQIKFINSAVSGQTTTMALRNLTAHLKARPTWIFCMLGMNDALGIGGDSGMTVVSTGETKRNLDFIHQLSNAACNPKWVWLTPYQVDEKKQEANPWFRQLQLKWRNVNLAGIRGHLLTKREPVVDLQTLSDGAGEEILLDDGVHVSMEGHIQIVKLLLNTLSEQK